MKVEKIGFHNFRNLEDCYIEPCGGVNIIYGKNAQGKTNILEALWLFCGGHSFRAAAGLKDVIRFNESSARLDCAFFGQDRSQKASIVLSSGKKNVILNGVEKKSSSALIEKFCAVVFSPENLNLIKRGPGERRNFLDSALCREKLRNAVILSNYNKLISQRNALLKDIVKRPSLRDTIDIWDAQIISAGSRLIRKRLDYVELISERAAFFHKGISRNSEELKLRYISGIGAEKDDSLEEIEKKFVEKFRKNRQNELASGVTLTGPHRDDIDILINSKSARQFASQGQQRSAILSLKLAEAAVLKDRMGENPVILLDDVLSELDNDRQDFLLNELEDCQVFITCCERSNKEQLKKGRVFFVEKGKITREDQ